MSIRHLLNIKGTKAPVAGLHTFISATEFDNFIQRDGICDWLSIVLPKNPITHPLAILFEKGVHFEANVIDTLSRKIGTKLLKLSSLTTSREYDAVTHRNDLAASLDAMKRGQAIIYSPYLASEKEGLRGIPDLIVRSDKISTFFDVTVDEGESVFGNWYYVPVEIKFSTLHWDKSSRTLLNLNRTKIYKTQLCTYAKILSDLQGTFPRQTFIIGKNTERVSLPYTQLGTVDFRHRDNEIVSLFYEGVEWLRDVKKHAHEWDFSVKLLPNMKVSHPLYDNEKKKIAEHFGDITEFWQCSVKHRDKMLEASEGRITSWRDPNFSVDILGVNESVRPTLEKMVAINRDSRGLSISPSKLKHNLSEWRDEDANEMFVDFETVGDLEESECFIFLIGVRYRGRYTSFLAEEISDREEKLVVNAFYKFWCDSGCPKAWYWYAEDGFWSRVVKKHNLFLPVPVLWVYLYKVFSDSKEPVLVHGCKNFKLKSYVMSLLALGKIKIDMPPEDCCNGMSALFLAVEYYDDKLDQRDDTKMKTIIKYNAFDCKSLYVLLQFIRAAL